MKPDCVGFIGGGHIAEALIKGITASGYLDAGKIVVSDVDDEKLQRLEKAVGIRPATDNAVAASQAGILFLAVKPDQISEVADEIAGVLTENVFVVSVAAGKPLGSIKEHLNGHKNVCRIMPNLAASVGKGTIGLFAEKEHTAKSLSAVWSLLSSVGGVLRIEDEKLMATVTALAGSAPAYYVMMADALVRFAVSQGMDESAAREMILSTMEGSACWASNSDTPLDKLWKAVVTPGGTTEAGIKYYDEKKFIEIFVEGLRRAAQKNPGF